MTRSRSRLLALTAGAVRTSWCVMFPCAALVDHAADHISIYYGAADTVVCLAHGHVSEILEATRGSLA